MTDRLENARRYALQLAAQDPSLGRYLVTVGARPTIRGQSPGAASDVDAETEPHVRRAVSRWAKRTFENIVATRVQAATGESPMDEDDLVPQTVSQTVVVVSEDEGVEEENPLLRRASKMLAHSNH